jgi:ABC-2 type transport system ATP-binding protein
MTFGPSIGLEGQHAAVDEVLTGRQNLKMFGRLYHLGGRSARRRADELLQRFGLAEAASRQAKDYSGGMRGRWLDLAASFILAPPVLFLDEPTTGLDLRGCNEVWDAVRPLVTGGTTVLFDTGRVIADGVPEELKSRIGGGRIDIVVRSTDDLARTAVIVGRACKAESETDPDRRRISAPVGQ